jgi:hypothetical protein
MIIILFSIITEILKAECDLSNKKIKDELNKDEEVCLMEDIKEGLKRLFKWSPSMTKNTNELIEWRLDLENRLTPLFDWRVDLENRLASLTESVTKNTEKIEALKTGQDILFEWADGITVVADELKAFKDEQMITNSEVRDRLRHSQMSH